MKKDLEQQIYFEDMEIGDKVVSVGRTITEADIVSFAGLTGDYNTLHTDAEFAKGSIAGQRLAHGMLPLTYSSGLFTRTSYNQAMMAQMAALTEINWKFKKPVLIGDTIHVEQEVIEKADPRPESDMGKVTFLRTIFNQRGEIVQQGEFKQLIRKYPKYQGGFIWDFVDQSVRWTGKNRKMIYAYGGDFNKFDASDNNFCDNGLISPDRVPNPHMYEVGYYYQDIWTTPGDLSKGEIKVYNENFFRDLSAYYLEWEMLKGGKVVRSGRVDDLKVAPQQTSTIRLDLGETCQCTEWLLNVSYKLKNREGLLPAGHTVAKDQLTLNPYKAPSMELKNVETTNIETKAPVVQDSDANYLIVEGCGFRTEFNRENGYLIKYEVNGQDMIKEGEALTPNFWRAPTDNDFGAGLQKKYAAWKNPEMKLTSLNQRMENKQVIVEAAYDMPTVSAKLNLTYVINNKGAIKVTQKMTADKNAKVSPMFRFGMQMPMPRSFENIEYYGRGPVENYIDRKGNADLAIYRQTVDEQFYSYIRPQENGTKSDIRWWKMLNEAGNGIEVVASAPFSASALHYTIESLDDGARKDQRHSPEVEEADLTNLCLDKVQMGLGCVNSWGTIALPEYQIPYGDYEFTFILTPVKHSIEIE